MVKEERSESESELELEFTAVSRDERSKAMSSPVIKVYGSTGVEARALETTEMGDRNNPYGAWATGRKSEATGVLLKEAPVSKTIGNAVGTESEAVGVGAEATTVGVGATVAEESTVGVATEVVGVAEAKVSKVGLAPIRETNRR